MLLEKGGYVPVPLKFQPPFLTDRAGTLDQHHGIIQGSKIPGDSGFILKRIELLVQEVNDGIHLLL